jgi:hypothetical protein
VFKVAIWVEAFFSSSGEQMPRLIAVTARNLLLAGGPRRRLWTGAEGAKGGSVCPELDNALYSLEMMPLTPNQRKSAKIGQRQIDLARRWNRDGLLSDEGFKAAFGAEGGVTEKLRKGPWFT